MKRTTLRVLAFQFFLCPVLAAGPAAFSRETAQPIRLHPKNPRYFLFRGQPTVLVTSGEHYGSVLNADFDYRKYLQTLARDGLNYTRLFGGSYVEVPGKSFAIERNDLAPEPGRFIAPWVRSEVPGYAGGGNKFDLSRMNPEYFRRYTQFLAEAAKLGIVVEVSLFSSSYGEPQWKLSPFHPANNVNHTEVTDWKQLHTLQNGSVLGFQQRYTEELVRAAGQFDNVIFEIQNEPWSDRTVLADVINPYLERPGRDRYPNSIDLADEASLAWQAAVAEWISREESQLPAKHLIAQNYSNFRFPVRSLLPGVSIVNFHYAYAEAALWNDGLDKAIAYDETGFLGREDAAYRREAWNFLLSGGATFDALDYSFSPGHEDGSDDAPNGPGGGSRELRRELGILRKFLSGFALAELRPDHEVVKHAAGAVARVLSTPGGQYAVYLDGSGPVRLALGLPKGRYSGEWIDVISGQPVRSENFEHSGGTKILESPSFADGIALRLLVN